MALDFEFCWIGLGLLLGLSASYLLLNKLFKSEAVGHVHLGSSFIFALAKAAVSGELHLLLGDLSREYGAFWSFQVFNMTAYVVTDNDLIQTLFERQKVFPSRGQNGIEFFIPESLLGYADNCAKWKQHRSILSNVFTDSCLKQYVDDMMTIGHELVRKLSADEIVSDINEFFAQVAYDVLSHTVLGKSWVKMFPSVTSKEENSMILNTAAIANLIPKSTWSFFPFPGRKISTAASKRMRTSVQYLIAKIRESNEQDTSMLHHLVHHAQSLSDNEIVDELLSMVMAGHETTANTLAFACTALAFHPEVQARMRKETSAIMDAKNESKIDKTMTYSDIQQMPYLWAVLRETLRLFPTVPSTFRVSQADAKLGDYDVKKGSRVFVNIFAVCRDERNFPSPLQFSPERWLPESGEGNVAAMKSHDITRNFGGGLRVCIGKRFAEEEFIVILALLISKFEVRMVSVGGEPCPDGYSVTDIPTVSNITMTFAKKVSLQFVPVV